MNPNTPPQRNFTLFDLVVLGAATAAGFAVFRALRIDLAMHGRPYGENWLSRIADQVLLAIVPFLITWTLAFPFVRLRAPRPPFRRLARQPEMAGCTAASVAIVYELIWIVYIALKLGVQWGWRFLPDSSGFLRLNGDLVSLWVAAAWMVLAFGGWWRAEPGWVDRLGRLLCLTWIVTKLVEAAFYHVP
jgi:hypothetical protein